MSKLGLLLHDVQAGWVSSALDSWNAVMPAGATARRSTPPVSASAQSAERSSWAEPAAETARSALQPGISRPAERSADDSSRPAPSCFGAPGRTAVAGSPARSPGADAAALAVHGQPSGGGAGTTAVLIRRDDWDALFDAVNERLRQAVEQAPTRGSPGLTLPGQPASTQEIVLDCVAALKHLQASPIAETDSALRRSGRPLPDHAAFQRALQRMVAETSRQSPPGRADAVAAASFAVVRIDIEGIRALQIEHGRAVVDDLLAVLASRLSQAVRSDDLLCRFSSEEYGCLPAALHGREPLQRLACKLYDTLAAPVTVRKRTLTVQPSLGLAIFPSDGQAADDLLRSANAALQDAKTRQAGYAFFDRPGKLRTAHQ